MWTAKCKTMNGIEVDIELSPRFNSAQECSNYIQNNLQVLEFLLRETQQQIDNIQGKFVLRFGSYVRPYNIEQKRWADGFDF